MKYCGWILIVSFSCIMTIGLMQYYYIFRPVNDVIRQLGFQHHSTLTASLALEESLSVITQPINANVPLILVVAYFRSGSSLTGELFALHNRSFYLFEPSRADYIDWMTPHERLLNSTLEKGFPSPVRLDDVTIPLRQMIGCSFSHMTKEYALNPFYWFRSFYPGVKPFVWCAKQHGVTSAVVSQCYTNLERVCPLNFNDINMTLCFLSLHEAKTYRTTAASSSVSERNHGNNASSAFETYVRCIDELHTQILPCVHHLEYSCKMAATRAVKTIRLDVTFVRELLRTSSLNIKVIHLVRDPRGMLLSRKVTQKRPLTAEHAIKTCTRLFNNVRDFRLLQQEFPGTGLQVRYEDLVSKPLDIAKLIYKHTAIDSKLAKEYLRIWLRKTNDPGNNGIFNTYRPNSTAEAYDWLTKLNSRDRRFIESFPECSNVIRELEYPSILR